jgi:uncharacterized membrane protein YfcA
LPEALVEALGEPLGGFFVQWAVMAAAATLAAWVGSVAGTGGTTILLPVLVPLLGVKDALPVLTICNFTANASRAWINRREIETTVVVWFLVAGVPCTLLGAYLFTRSSPEVLLKFLGALLIALILWRHVGKRFTKREWHIRHPRTFAPVGGGFGFLYGFTEGVGALMAPFFLAYGLVRGAYIGTDALGTMVLQGTKLAVFGQFDVLHGKVLLLGLTLAPFMVLGSWVGKRTMKHVPATWFTRIVEVTVLVSGVSFLLA